MFARGDRGFGLTEFLVVTVVVAVAVGVFLACCSEGVQPTDPGETALLSPQAPATLLSSSPALCSGYASATPGPAAAS
jgi:prepilin-type N-terminal cleavage/methylation domain-containing protein